MERPRPEADRFALVGAEVNSFPIRAGTGFARCLPVPTLIKAWLMSDNPPGPRAAFPFQWLALIVLGLAAGYALRVATRPAEASAAISEEIPAAALSRDGPASGADSSSHRTRPATRETPAAKGRPLTADQAEALLFNPANHRLTLDQILGSKMPSSGGTDYLTGFFEWDESEARQVLAALETFSENVRSLIDRQTLIDHSEPGVMTFDYSPLDEDYRREIDLLHRALEDTLGGSRFRQFDTLGILREVETAVTPDTRLTLRLGPIHENPAGGYVLGLSLEDGESPYIQKTHFRFRPGSPDLPEMHWIMRLPSFDWTLEIQRAHDAAPK
jgi:hypothetical protein